MKIGILSDTHSCFDPRFARHFADCHEIWHAGDVGDITVIRQLEEICHVVRAVRGNVDHGLVNRECPEFLKFDCQGVKVWMTHIGGSPGRYSPGVKKILKEEGINLFISGHSHILKVMPDPELGLLHINPGAAGNQGWQLKRTLVTIEISDGIIHDLNVIELSPGYS